MKLKTEPSMFQNIVLIAWICIYSAICSEVWKRMESAGLIEDKQWLIVVVIYAILIVLATLIGRALQFAFGLPWLYGNPYRTCALSLRWLDEYQPSSVRVSGVLFSGKRNVVLRLVLGAGDLAFLSINCPRSSMNYFLIFEGYFPFAAEKKTQLYLTRAARRQLRRAVKNANKDAGSRAEYAQLKFELNIPYSGREFALLDDSYYLLSRWDIREIEYLVQKTTLTFGGLTLSPKKLAKYSKRLEATKPDTFIKVVPEPEE